MGPGMITRSQKRPESPRAYAYNVYDQRGYLEYPGNRKWVLGQQIIFYNLPDWSDRQQ